MYRSAHKQVCVLYKKKSDELRQIKITLVKQIQQKTEQN
jgi:hypothetical protein